jgi:enamine deaminase RidA (YjgF/YER057c/UK114 family)
MSFDKKFLELGDEIPPIPQLPPNLEFVLWRRYENLFFSAGHVPQWGTEFRYLGKVGSEFTVAQGSDAARLTTLNLLQSLRQSLGTLDTVIQVVDVLGMVNSAPGFTEQPNVINGCSKCLVQVFGESGRHTRMAVGAAELPFSVAVEIKMVVEIASR